MLKNFMLGNDNFFLRFFRPKQFHFFHFSVEDDHSAGVVLVKFNLLTKEEMSTQFIDYRTIEVGFKVGLITN